jgi:hypothetical protein
MSADDDPLAHDEAQRRRVLAAVHARARAIFGRDRRAEAELWLAGEAMARFGTTLSGLDRHDLYTILNALDELEYDRGR